MPAGTKEEFQQPGPGNWSGDRAEPQVPEKGHGARGFQMGSFGPNYQQCPTWTPVKWATVESQLDRQLTQGGVQNRKALSHGPRKQYSEKDRDLKVPPRYRAVFSLSPELSDVSFRACCCHQILKKQNTNA